MKNNKRAFYRHPTFIVFIFFAIIILISNHLFSEYIKELYPYKEPGIYGRDFFMGILVNLNSSIIDFFVIGIIVFFIDTHRNNKEKQLDSLQRLSDYSTHSSLELNLRKLTLVKQLLSQGKILDLDGLALDGITLKDMNFEGHSLTGFNLSNCILKNCHFVKCDLKAVILNGSQGDNVSFDECKIDEMKLIDGKYKNLKITNSSIARSKFRKSDLRSCEITNCNMKNCEYTNANFNRAKLERLKDFDLNEFSKTENANYIKTEEDNIDKLKIIQPNIKF